MDNKTKIMELLDEIEKQAVQFKNPVLAHAIGGGLLGAATGAAMPVYQKKNPNAKKNPNELHTRIGRAAILGGMGALGATATKLMLNDFREGRILDMYRKSRETIRFNGVPTRVLNIKHYDPAMEDNLKRRMRGIL